MKAKISPWIFVVALGVLAILFAVFGLQSQTDALAAQEEVAQLRVQLQQATTEAMRQQGIAAEFAKRSADHEKELAARLEECMKARRK